MCLVIVFLRVNNSKYVVYVERKIVVGIKFEDKFIIWVFLYYNILVLSFILVLVILFVIF